MPHPNGFQSRYLNGCGHAMKYTLHRMAQSCQVLQMFYNAANWGSMNKNLTVVANRINETGGNAVSLDLEHADIPKYFFHHFKSDY